jgi:hypothetical protein
MKKISLLSLLVYLTLGVFAQIKPELSLSGNFVNISEFRQGYKTILAADADPAFVISQRSRLILDYKSEKFDFRFSVQDARAWGETFIINSSKAVLMHEAWMRYNLNRDFNFTIGRQAIKYGDERIFSDRNWSIYGAAHDAGIFRYNRNKLELDFGYALNSANSGILENTAYSINNYQSMSWLWASKEFGSDIKINFINLMAFYQKPGTLTNYGLNTLGINPVIKKFGFGFDGAAYFQFGKNKNGNHHQAHIYTANLDYSIQFLEVGAGYDHYSGKKYSDLSAKDKHFVQIMETIPHGFLGFMDFDKGSQFKSPYGISDLNFYLKYGKKTTFAAYYHALAYAEEMEEGISRKIGNEFDFLITHKFGSNHTLNVGYSFMLPHDDLVLKALGTGIEASFAHWAWVKVTFNPKFL